MIISSIAIFNKANTLPPSSVNFNEFDIKSTNTRLILPMSEQNIEESTSCSASILKDICRFWVIEANSIKNFIFHINQKDGNIPKLKSSGFL